MNAKKKSTNVNTPSWIKLEKEVEKAVRSYISSEDFDWYEEDWSFEDIHDQYDNVDSAIIEALSGMGIKDEDSEVYDEEYGRLAAKADAIANVLLEKKHKEFVSLEKLIKKIIIG